MMKKLLIISILLFIPVFNVCLADSQTINSETSDEINRQIRAFNSRAGFEASDGETVIANTISIVIKAFLSLLGIIFVILMLIAGYNWMTAAGEEEKVRKAQKTIQRAIIGLVIIVLAYSITYFIFDYLGEAMD